MQDAKLSIITVCYNAERTIERTIKSVITQTYKNIEYVVIDGQSTDKTLDLLKSYKNSIAVMVSEKDKGIYDAMNKGLDLSSGTYILLLNADDYLFSPNTIENMMVAIGQHNDEDIFYGNLLMFDDKTGRGKIWKPGHISGKLLYSSTLPHPATIYKRTIFDKLNKFDETYKIAADYEFYVRAYTQGANFRYLNQLVSVFSYGGISTSGEYKRLTHDERKKTLLRHFSASQRLLMRMRVRIKKVFNL
jgi:glycosyltransferase involved in cell wall biosynthesis